MCCHRCFASFTLDASRAPRNPGQVRTGHLNSGSPETHHLTNAPSPNNKDAEV